MQSNWKLYELYELYESCLTCIICRKILINSLKLFSKRNKLKNFSSSFIILLKNMKKNNI